MQCGSVALAKSNLKLTCFGTWISNRCMTSLSTICQQDVAQCAENMTSQLSVDQTAVVINSLQTLTVILQKHQKTGKSPEQKNRSVYNKSLLLTNTLLAPNKLWQSKGSLLV